MSVDRARLEALLAAERTAFVERHPRSRAAYGAADHLLGRVPMTWMGKTAGPFPLYLAGASGARVTDLDGHELVDFCLGDTGAMAGHSPPAVVEAVTHRLAIAGGATAMLPTEDAEVVAAELTRRFGVGQWSFSLTATDANRWALRLCRRLTGRPRVLVHSECYHGSVDESFVVATPDGTRPRPGTEGGPGDVTAYGRAVEFNDLAGLEAALAPGDVAALLMEHMTALADRYTAGARALIEENDLPWSVSRLGARAELAFARPAPRNGGEGAAAVDGTLDDHLHLHLLNRGVLLTPFHNMTLMCPATTDADVDLHLEVLADAVATLVGG